MKRTRAEVLEFISLAIITGLLILFLTMALSACKAVPVIGPDGEPTGDVRYVFDDDAARDAAEAGAGAAASVLPPPWNALATSLLGLGAFFFPRKEGDE